MAGGRMTRRAGAAAVALVAAFAAAAPAGADPNPRFAVGDAEVHDPSIVVRGVTPRYLMVSTHNQARLSTDRQTWVPVGPVLPAPGWTRAYANGEIWAPDGSGDLWAPDVSFHDGRYWLYYAVSQIATGRSAIGLATSTSGEPGSWTDKGPVIVSDGGSPYNAIDPDLLVDPGGRWWLAFGNGSRGVHVVELDPGTGMLKTGATPAKVATGGDIKAPALYHHGGHYYLFAAYGSCCPPPVNPAPPSSHIKVGRSTSPTGPFDGRHPDGPMFTGGGTAILGTHGDYVGPGGPDPFYDARDDAHLLAYHYYDRRLNYTSFFGHNYLGFDASGWPYFPEG